MLYETLITVALAGAAVAFTPAGFEPASKKNLTVAFGNTLAVNGVDIPKAGWSPMPNEIISHLPTRKTRHLRQLLELQKSSQEPTRS